MNAKTSTYDMVYLDKGRMGRRETFACPQRFLAKCPCCKAPLSALVTSILSYGQNQWAETDTAAHEYGNGRLTMRCPCGRAAYVGRVLGKYSAKHQCNAKCLASTSGKCECSCGGKNHGASYA